MKLLGYASGRIYEADSLDDLEAVPECYYILSKEELETIEEDPFELEYIKSVYRAMCLTCQMLDDDCYVNCRSGLMNLGYI